MKIELYNRSLQQKSIWERDTIPFVRITKACIWIISSKLCQDLKLGENDLINFTVSGGLAYLVIPKNPVLERDLVLKPGSVHGRVDHSKKFCSVVAKRWLFKCLSIEMPDTALFQVDTENCLIEGDFRLYKMQLKMEGKVKP